MATQFVNFLTGGQMNKDELKAKFLLYLEYWLGRLGGRFITWNGKLALKRGDLHEFTHSFAALTMGNSSECYDNPESCMVAGTFEQTEVPQFDVMDTSFSDLGLENWMD
jgi:hypothetical protein